MMYLQQGGLQAMVVVFLQDVVCLVEFVDQRNLLFDKFEFQFVHLVVIYLVEVVVHGVLI